MDTARYFKFCPSYVKCPTCGRSNPDLLKWTAPNGKDVTENTTTSQAYKDIDE